MLACTPRQPENNTSTVCDSGVQKSISYRLRCCRTVSISVFFGVGDLGRASLCYLSETKQTNNEEHTKPFS